MSLLVALPAALVEEELAAVLAGVALALGLVDVDYDVLLEVGGCRESLLAYLARKWLLPCVDLLMAPKIGCLGR